MASERGRKLQSCFIVSHKQTRLLFNMRLFACFHVFLFIFGSNIGLSLRETKAQPFYGKLAVCLFKTAWTSVISGSCSSWRLTWDSRALRVRQPCGEAAWFCGLNARAVPVSENQTFSLIQPQGANAVRACSEFLLSIRFFIFSLKLKTELGERYSLCSLSVFVAIS